MPTATSDLPGPRLSIALRDDAAAYIIIDTPTADAPSTGSTDPSRGHQAGGASSGGGEDGTEAERGTVFRLAHRTFVDYFSISREQYAESVEDDRVKAATALLGMAAQAAGADPASLPTYLVRHLSGHIADAHLWDTLASDPGVLDCLDPDAVTADALRTLFGQRDIPPAVAGVIGARDALLIAPPADRAGLRQMATATHSAQQVIDEPTASWGVSAAHARSVTPHVRLSGHTASLNSVRSLNLPGRGTILASASDDEHHPAMGSRHRHPHRLPDARPYQHGRGPGRVPASRQARHAHLGRGRRRHPPLGRLHRPSGRRAHDRAPGPYLRHLHHSARRGGARGKAGHGRHRRHGADLESGDRGAGRPAAYRAPELGVGGLSAARRPRRRGGGYAAGLLRSRSDGAHLEP